MGKDVSLILAPGKSLADIIKAGQSAEPADAIQGAVDVPKDEYYANFAQYLKDIIADNDFKDTSDFNRKSGFIASWILSSVKPAWYLRNCSVSLFLESEDVSPEKWARYTSDWKATTESVLPGLDIENHFTDVNYSLGCLISPENCKNFIADYGSDAQFKLAVDKHFGIFVGGLFDALQTSIETNTDLIEAVDIFIVYMMDPNTNRWQFIDQYSYSTDTYNETNIALQAFSIEAQVYDGHIKIQENKGDAEKANAYQAARQRKIDMMVQNGNVYADKIRARTGLDLPELTPEMWS